ncbi:hypothetical protein OESDEN_16721 [Oesophagostomum dentatum]|uniref:Uncharacterized protein n=1 Tax=Oesophagostomum dentatum TaxID=61180 RepID=A0A0B1SF81_OESDE|nr:hypothetical protein OESDEN_16721 [Oesophagostomum dentatum]
MSNIIGMYSQQNIGHKPGVDYPNVAGWPAGYVPIAVHTVALPLDYVGQPFFPCKRRDILWKMALNSTEMQEFINSKHVSLT